MKATAFTKTGTKAAEVVLPKGLFERPVNADLLGRAYNQALSNIRTNNAKTLTRSEVRGGGRKPWRQKGTGRARFGSTRNPIWRHGGVAFGPTGIENYHTDMPKTMARSALAQALSAQVKNVVVIEKFAIAEAKTQAVVALLAKLGVEGQVLMVAATMDQDFARASRNVAGVELVTADRLSVLLVLNADVIVIEKTALEALQARLETKK